MGQQGETKFKNKVLKDLKTLPKCKVRKTQERARRGVLDLTICLDGRFVEIELKIDGEKPTPLQEESIRTTRAAGGIAFHTTPALWEMHFKMLKEMIDA